VPTPMDFDPVPLVRPLLAALRLVHDLTIADCVTIEAQ